MSKPKRTSRRTVNPLFLVAGMQKIGQDGMRDVTLPYMMHLYEISQGYGYAMSIRFVTIYTSAMHEVGLYFRHKPLQELIDRAGDLWIRAGDRCTAKGIFDRIILNGDEPDVMRRVLWAMVDILPGVDVGVWSSFVENATRRWDKYVATSAFKNVAIA